MPVPDRTDCFPDMIRVIFLTAVLLSTGGIGSVAPTVVAVDPGHVLQRFDGLGCGTIFFEGHIHVDWGNSWKLTKIYHGFRQFASRLVPGMHVVQSTVTGPGASGISQPGVKACAFRSKDTKRTVVNIANVQDQATEIVLKIQGSQAGNIKAWRTSGTENIVPLPASPAKNGPPTYSLPPRGMLTIEINSP